MSADTVSVEKEEVVEREVEQEAFEPVAETSEAQERQTREEQVPVSAMIKERRKRQDAEQEARWYKEQLEKQAKPTESVEDESRFEAATKDDLHKSNHLVVRQVQENIWIKDNPDKAEFVDEKLLEFLKQRPNLKLAIEAAPNRYEEAWELMDKLTPKQKAALRPAAAKKDSPGQPSAVPKAAAMNEGVDVMMMSDKEFAEYRAAKRKKR